MDIFAVMNCSVLALVQLGALLIYDYYSDTLYNKRVRRVRVRRIICMLCQQTSP